MHVSYHLTFFTQISAFFSITMWCVFRTISNIYDEAVNYFHEKKYIFGRVQYTSLQCIMGEGTSVPIVKFEHVIAGWDVYVCFLQNLLVDYNTIHVLPIWTRKFISCSILIELVLIFV